MTRAFQHILCSLLAAMLMIAASASITPASAQDPAAEAQAIDAAQTPGNIMFILDASGSMWGQVGGRTKIEIARESLAKVIESLPAGINVGLTAYGHNREGDCSDVEELVPLGPLDKEGLIAIINSINPKGKTPITHSVQITAQALRHLETPTTILLVSDGKETCEGDPCALVAELRASGINFIVDVIGFDVTDEERAQLECIAEAGGGTYYSANTVDEFLNAAMQSVDRPELSGGRLHLTTLRNGQEIETFVEILDMDGNRLDYDFTTPGLGRTFRLVPGDYQIVVTDKNTVGEPSVTLTLTMEGQDIEKVVDFTAGTIRIPTTRNGEPRECTVKVYALETHEELAYTFSDSPDRVAVVHIPAGTYDVEVTDNRLPGSPVVELPGVTVTAGETVEYPVDFATGNLAVTVTRNGQPISADARIQPVGSPSLIAVEHPSPSEPARFELLAGDYTLVIQDTEAGSHIPLLEQTITIDPQGNHELTVESNLGVLDVSVYRNEMPFEAEVIVYVPGSDGNFLTTATAYDGRAEILLAPGTYKVEVVDYNSEEYPYPSYITEIPIMQGRTSEIGAYF